MQRIGVSAPASVTAVIVAGTETVVATVGPLITNADGETIVLVGHFEGVVNAMTSYGLFIRRGTTTAGTIVSDGATITAAGLAAANSYRAVVLAVDAPAASGPLFYVLTWNPTGANTASFVANLVAFLL